MFTMRNFYKFLLAIVVAITIGLGANAQGYWSAREDSRPVGTTDKAVARLSYPKIFKLFDLNIEPLRQQLFTIVSPAPTNRSTIISIPNADGNIEQFQVWEASNFEPDLQLRFPEIRAFSGRGITDRYAMLKLSISPQGIQTMVFRTEKENEFIEAYSADHTTYAVYKSQREKGSLPWTCTTDEKNIYNDINGRIPHNTPSSNAGQLKTMRLAQSCNGEYSNFFGAFNSGQVALVLAAFNATLTRCNGCYEKDLAIHLNLISATTNVIFYDPATDPYTTLGQWNLQLQQTLTSIIGSPNYDIGHMFGASGGGGNAGCIGCVCVDPSGPNSVAKGGGITSPADGIPMGDNFDIDYVVHEVGHQMGANHTFSHSNEGTGQNKEVGSGITIMGYAGITSYDPAPHSIDIYHETSIDQIQNNMAGKSCPITTSLAGINAMPNVAPVGSVTIPANTPFVLTASASDPDGDPITYCWEQTDNGAGQSAANSVAYPAKPTGPNYLSFPPTTSPSRMFPKLSTVLAGLSVTPPFPGGDAICNIEALSTISRTLNFRVTVRDNRPYNGTAVGQTNYTDMTVTVTSAAGPFQVTSPNTNVTWSGGSTQTVTWAVNNTNAAPVNCANVMISLSTDGGQTFPTVLIASTPNDGSETITVPSTPTTTARIKVEAVGNVFFDISNTNFTIDVPFGFTFNPPSAATSSCPAGPTMALTLGTSANGGFNTPINLTASGNPSGTTVSFSPNPITPGASTVVTLNGTNTLSAGTYNFNVTGTAGAVVQTVSVTYIINTGTPPVINSQPVSQTVCQNIATSFSVTATGVIGYQWQKSTDGGATWNNVAGAINATYNIASAQPADAGMYRCVVSGQCGIVNSSAATLTVNISPLVTTQPLDQTMCASSNVSFTIAASGNGLSYQWQLSLNGCAGPWNNIAGATSATYTITGITAGQNNTGYRCVVTGSCAPPATSNCAVLTVVTSVQVTTQPNNATVCEGSNASFTVAGSGSGILYQWQISTDGGANYNNISGATAATYTVSNATFAMNNNRYRALLSNATCTTPGVSNAGVLTVNTLPAVTSSPSNTTICVGAGNTFSVAATGTGATYQWQISTDGGATWSNIAGATSNSYSVSSVIIGMNGYHYRAVVSGTCAPPATSSDAVLTVIAPVSVTAQPTASEICSGSNTSFSATASSVQSINYQWQVSTDGGANWTNVTNGTVYSGATTATLSITGATAAMSNNRYRLLLSNATCTAPTISNTALLTVRQLPTIGLTASPLTSLLPGQSTTLTATPSASTGGVLTTSWLFNTLPLGVVGNNYVVNVEKIGAYQVKIQEVWPSSLTCANQSGIVTINATVSDKLFIFPTPNDGRFTVSYYNNGSASTQRRIVIFSTSGGKVYDRIFPITGPYTLLNIDLHGAARGIYYVMVGDAAGNKLVDGKVHVR
jgi:hypothetical protein